MPAESPKFRAERELVEWFETVDLAGLELEEAVDVEVADQITLSIVEPRVIRAGRFGDDRRDCS